MICNGYFCVFESFSAFVCLVNHIQVLINDCACGVIKRFKGW